MAATGSSTPSFVSSIGSAPPSYNQHVSPVDSAWTPNTVVSTVRSDSSDPHTALAPLDLPPPAFNATIKLFEGTVNENTLYLGPWEITATEPRRIIWQCSYEGAVIEHFLAPDVPTELIPYSLHAQHRPFGDPRELELYLTFRGPHRVRYATSAGVIHDEYIEVKYDFTSIEISIQFQGDVRGRELIDWFDVDVVWSDTHGRTDSYGNIRGLGTIQRMKMWRDNYTTSRSLTFFANHRRRWKEYLVNNFETELRNRDDRHRRLRLQVRSDVRRNSATSTSSNRDRRFSATSIFRPRQASVAASAPVAGGNSVDVRYLSIQFTRNDRVQQGSDDYHRFLERWRIAQSVDSEFGVSFPVNRHELPSPDLVPLSELEDPGGPSNLAYAPDDAEYAEDVLVTR